MLPNTLTLAGTTTEKEMLKENPSTELVSALTRVSRAGSPSKLPYSKKKLYIITELVI